MDVKFCLHVVMRELGRNIEMKGGHVLREFAVSNCIRRIVSAGGN